MDEQQGIQIDEVLYLRRAVARERIRASQAEDNCDRLGAAIDQLMQQNHELAADNDRLAETIAKIAKNQSGEPKVETSAPDQNGR